jgi:hypothetical protein
VPLQQPFGHDAASQTHCPVPELHSVPAPHALQVAPPAPHEEFVSAESGSHAPALQQPEQEEPPQVQAPLEHASPPLHGLHATPAVPHSLADWVAYGTQVSPLQQPPGHEVASHTHFPLDVHSWPATHAAQLAPSVPQAPFDSEAYPLHVPLMPPLQQPFGQVFESQAQSPSVLSQRPLLQAAQAAPPDPHREADCAETSTHVSPLQQPNGHEVASQTHLPMLVLHS